MITSKVEVKKNDILIINTGFHRYAWDQPESDEIRYFVKAPRPRSEIPRVGPGHEAEVDRVDCGSLDHPMNTIIRNWHPGPFVEAEKKLKAKYGKPG